MRLLEKVRAACPKIVILVNAGWDSTDLEWVAPLCGPHTQVLAMKGRLPEAEIAAVSAPWSIREVVPLQVPGLNEERHLIIATCRLGG